MKRLLIVLVLLLAVSLPAAGFEGDCTKNSFALYGALSQPEYWAYPANIGEGYEPIRFPLELVFAAGFGFDFGWGFNEKIDLTMGFNQFLRGPTADVDGNNGPDHLAVTPIYMNIRYKTPFQLYFGAGFNWAVIRMEDNGLQYGESGGFGFQGFGGLEMRGTSGSAMSYGLFFELGYCYMTGSTHDLVDSTMTRIIQHSAGLYGRAGVRKYF